MSESVFFNPGDSLGNFHDYDDAVKTAQIYRDKQKSEKPVIVVHGKGKESFDIFLSDSKKSDGTADETSTYFVNKRV